MLKIGFTCVTRKRADDVLHILIGTALVIVGITGG
jgi:hypothetical protein